jgi:hypothetical protein
MTEQSQPARTKSPFVKENSTTDGRQPGDPVRAAEAIIKAVQADKPPFRLVLGRSAVQRIRAELDAQRRELDSWEETANAVDYPARST